MISDSLVVLLLPPPPNLVFWNGLSISYMIIEFCSLGYSSGYPLVMICATLLSFNDLVISCSSIFKVTWLILSDYHVFFHSLSYFWFS